MSHTTVKRGRQLIRADYHGGPYIDLSIGTSVYNPIEVINVWDDDTDAPESTFGLDSWDRMNVYGKRQALWHTVIDWMKSNDLDNPDWYEDYLENARH